MIHQLQVFVNLSMKFITGLVSYLSLVHDIEMRPDHFTFCAITNTLLLMSTTSSILFILQMTFGRFYSIIRPNKAASFNTVTKAKITIVIIVIRSILFNIPHIFMSTNVGKECVPLGIGMEKVAAQLLYYATFIVNFALPFVLLLVMNSVIIYTLRTRSLKSFIRSNGQGQNDDQISKLKNSEKQIFILLLLVTFAFLILTTPGYAMILYDNFVDYTKLSQIICRLLPCLPHWAKTYYTNYGINFFLYVISRHKFRSDLIHIFKCNNHNSNKNEIYESTTKTTRMSSITK